MARRPSISHRAADGTPLVHTLANGVRVVAERVEGVRSLAAGVWVDVGSRDEAPDEAGVTHFIEHMVFKGTERRRAHHIARHMESVGGYLNAFTAKEHTCYYARGLDEHLGRALDVVTDLAASPSFPVDEIPKEQEVVVEEMKMYEDQPEDLIFDRLERLLYPDSAMGAPIIGTEASVKSFDRDRLRGFVARQYVPAKLVVTVAGNIDPDKVLRDVEKRLGGLEARPALPRPEAGGFRAGTHEEARPTQQAHLAIATRALGLSDEKRTALGVLNTVLGGGMSSLLAQNIREKYGYCYNVYSFTNHYTDAGDVGVYIATEAAKVDHAERLIWRELDRLAQSPVTPRQLAQAKAQLKGGMMLGLEGLSARMNLLGRHALYFGRVLPLAEMAEEVDAVTADDVQGLAQRFFRRDHVARVLLTPEKDSRAAAADAVPTSRSRRVQRDDGDDD